MKMFKNSYPYLIAGLPDLLFEIEYKNFNLEELRTEIREQIHPSDLKILKDLYYEYDNLNLVNILLKRPLSFIPRGAFNLEQLQAEIAEPNEMPLYMRNFTDAFLGRTDEFIDPQDASLRLTEAFYKHIRHSPNGFIRKWFDFDRSLRNLQTAYLARKTQADPAKYLIDQGEEVEIILKNYGTGDFGIRPFVDFADRLFQIFELSNVLEKEQKLDILRWETADRIAEGKGFQIDVLAAYLIKANIVDRWSHLDEEKGLEIFKKMIEELKRTPISDQI
ncbi:MAG: DUF2764 family protein [Bacteroidales bacterium]